MQQKQCNMCKKIKLISEFNKSNVYNDGLQYYCKQCDKERKSLYRKTKIGLITRIYESQISNSKYRKYEFPMYSKKEFKKWMIDNVLFHELYNNWINSGCNIGLKPSVDRINDYKSYTFDNIQLMTWSDNKKKGHEDIKNGINNKISKAVIQYDLNNNFIKEYYSLHQADRETGIYHQNISKVCNNIRNIAGNFIWEYKSIKK